MNEAQNETATATIREHYELWLSESRPEAMLLHHALTELCPPESLLEMAGDATGGLHASGKDEAPWSFELHLDDYPDPDLDTSLCHYDWTLTAETIELLWGVVAAVFASVYGSKPETAETEAE